MDFGGFSLFLQLSVTLPRRYHISMTPAHTLAAQSCLGILLHLDKGVITRDSLKDFPLAKYAAKCWTSHALFEGVSHNVEDGIKQLFDPSKPHLTVCVWICDPADPTWDWEGREERPLGLPQTFLHYAASWGLHSMVEWLIIELSQNVCSQRSTDNATPLHLASNNGHMRAACKLIEYGADMTAQNKDGETALHLASQEGNVDLARMLIEHGADVTSQNKDGETALHLASQKGNVDLGRMLIEHSADMTAQNKDGETALHLASQLGYVDLACMLIERGADVTSQNKDKETALHLALQRGNMVFMREWLLPSQQLTVDVGHMLIEQRADLAAQN